MNARGVDGDHLYRGVNPSRPTAGRMSAVSPAGPPPEAGGVEADHARLQADVDLLCAELEAEQPS